MKILRRSVWLSCVMMILVIGTNLVVAAQPMPEVARKAACITCHKIDSKLIGPAFAWVAYKYKDDKEAGRKAIINQIINGGQGKWTKYTGMIIMPPYGSTTTEEQRNELADFILSLEPVAPPDM
jgi:cytochrome c